MTDTQSLQLFLIIVASIIAANGFNRWIDVLIMRRNVAKLFETIDIRKFEKNDRHE